MQTLFENHHEDLLNRLDAAIKRMEAITNPTESALTGLANLRLKHAYVASGLPFQLRQVNEEYIGAFGYQIGVLTKATGLRSIKGKV